MTWFLDQASPDAPVADSGAAPIDAPLPSGGAQFGAALQSTWARADAWARKETFQKELMGQMQDALGGEAGYKPRTGPEFQRYLNPRTRPDYLMERAAELVRREPERWGALPQNRVQFDGEIQKRRTDDLSEHEAVLARGDSPLAQAAGGLFGAMTDETSLPFLFLGGNLEWGLARFVAAEAVAGAAGEVPSLLKEQQVSTELGLAQPDAAQRIGTGALFGGAFGAILGGGARLLGYRAERTATEGLLREPGTPPLDHQIEIDAAEAALRQGEDPKPPTPLRPDPTLAPEADPAVDNILKLIGSAEAPRGFDQVFSGSVIAPPKPLTTMTIDEVLTWQKANTDAGAESSAAGGVQIIRGTLSDLKGELGLTGNELFDAAMQKRLGIALMKRRGLDDWRAGRISNEEFADNLAQEWAGLPLTTGGRRGASYYAGVGSNGATTTPEAVLAVLNGERAPDRLPPGGSGFTGAGATGRRRGPTLFDEVSTPSGRRIGVTYKIVDASQLKQAEGTLQPRDRARASSDEQIAKIAAELDPARLLPGPESDRGAPVIGPDGVIESGNGRVRAINLAAETNPQAHADYVRAITEETGLKIPEGVKRPVLVAERTTPLSDAERVAFIRESNTAAIARMSATEQAKFDAGYLDQLAFDAYRPGAKIGGPQNAEFVRRMFARIPQAERAGLIDGEGRLNIEGFRRIRAALFARAFDAEDLLRLAVETESPAVMSLVRMLEDLAPDWSAFRALVEAGYVRPEYDITAALSETLRIIARARASDRGGQSVIAAIRDRLGQADLFGDRDPMTDALVDVFYKGDRARGPEASRDILRRYIGEAASAGRADIADLAGGAPPPVEVLARAVAGEEGAAPIAALPARTTTEPPPVIETADFDPAPFADGTANPAVAQAADAALDDAIAQREARAELGALIKRGASAEEIGANPAVQAALSDMAARPLTTDLPQYGTETFWAARKYLAKGVELLGKDAAVDYLYRAGRFLGWTDEGLPPPLSIASERKAVILIGPPAAGKSTIANPLARHMKAAIIDADEAKKLIPEYEGGIGANAVHEESSTLSDLALVRAIAAGDNLILPKVGGSPESIRNLIARMKSQGYDARVVLVDVTPEEGWRRMIGRFLSSGRIIPPPVMEKGLAGAPLTYDILKKEGDANGFARIDNNPGLGEPRRIIEDETGVLPSDLGGNGSDRNAIVQQGDGRARGAASGRAQDTPLKQDKGRPPPTERLATILDRGDYVASIAEPRLTYGETRWLRAEFEAGRIEKQRDPSMNVVRYRRIQPESDATWQRSPAGEAAPAAQAPAPIRQDVTAAPDLAVTLTDATGASVTHTASDILDNLDAERNLELVLDACRIGGAAR